MNQVCFAAIGNDVTVTMAAEAGQLQLNVMEPAGIAQCMFESLSLLSNACTCLRENAWKALLPIKSVVKRMCSVQLVWLRSRHRISATMPVMKLVGVCRDRQIGPEAVLERGLLSEAQLNDIFSVENLKKPRYPGKQR